VKRTLFRYIRYYKDLSRLISGAPLQLSTSRGRCFGCADKNLCHFTVNTGMSSALRSASVRIHGNLQYFWGTVESGKRGEENVLL